MKTAIIIVDMQNDFCLPLTGALPVPGALNIIPRINRLQNLIGADYTFLSQDWHPVETKHFDKWPVHCVNKTLGSTIVHGLDIPRNAFIIRKGESARDDGYSAFDGHDSYTGATLSGMLSDLGVEGVYICGVATDYCIKATALDAKRYGSYETFLVTNCIAAVNTKSGEEALAEMKDAGIHFLEIH